MRYIKMMLAAAVLAFPALAVANADAVPGSANWYLFVDFEEMRENGPGAAIYNWLREEVLDEIKDDAGLDVEKELDRLVAYSTGSDHGVIVAEGNFSQVTRDRVMAFIASGGDINPSKASGRTYYRYGGNEEMDDDVSYDAGNIAFQIDSLAEESWISTAIKNKIIVTSTEAHMQELLASKGKLQGRGKHKDALLVLTANRALVQAGMKTAVIGEDAWDSNVLRNTKQVAFLIAEAGDMLSVQTKLTTIEAEMAESMASVVRGLVSLASFDEDMDDDVLQVIRDTKIEAQGNSLSISLEVNPDIVVSTLRD